MARAEIETPLYIGTNGHVVALDPWTGVELWRTKLPRCVGMGAIVSITVKHNLLFAGARAASGAWTRATGGCCGRTISRAWATTMSS